MSEPELNELREAVMYFQGKCADLMARSEEFLAVIDKSGISDLPWFQPHLERFREACAAPERVGGE